MSGADTGHGHDQAQVAGFGKARTVRADKFWIMRTLRLLIALAAAAAFMILPQAASAGEYFATTSAEITSKINQASAASGDDTVHIAAGNYTIDKNTFPNVSSGNGKIEIVGAGVGQTVLNGTANSADGGRLIYLSLPTESSTLSDFTLNVEFTSATFVTGVEIFSGGIADFAINQTGNPTSNNTSVVWMSTGNSAENGTISTQGTTVGLGTASAGNSVDNVSVTGNDSPNSIGVNPILDSTGTYKRVRVKGFASGIYVNGGSADISDSLVDMGATMSATGITVVDQNSSQPAAMTFAAVRNTIVGRGSGQLAISFQTLEGIDSISATLMNNVVYFPGDGRSVLRCSGSNATVNFDNLRYRGDIFMPTGGCSYDGRTDESALTGDPFRDFDAGDYRPAWNSPLIDTGATANPSSAVDAEGSARIVDGDGDSTATVDIGAYEYQRGAPTVSITTPKTNLLVLERTSFTANATDPEGEDLTYAWAINGTPSLQNPQTLDIGFTDAGVYSVGVTVTDEAGATGTATVTVNVAPNRISCPANLWGLKLTAKPKKAFSRTGKGFASPKKGKPYFTLGVDSGVVQVRFTLQSVSKSKKLKTVKGSQTVKASAGAKKFGFGGRFGGKNLKPGRYKVTAAAVGDGSPCGPNARVTVTFTLK